MQSNSHISHAPRWKTGGRRAISPFLIISIAVSLLPGFARLVGASPRAQQPTPTNALDVRVNQVTTADQQEPTLAVDPTNPNNILAAAKDWRTGPKQVWHYRSTDAGKTWADGYANLLPSELPNQSDPVIAFDKSGAAYMALLGYNQNDFSVGGLFVARTTDLGATWQPAVFVSANSEKVFNDKEWLTVDRSNNAPTSGNVYVTWTLFTTLSPTRERAQIVISRSTDGGKTFSLRQSITPVGQDAVQGSYPVVGPGGELYVLYFSSPDAAEEERAEVGRDATEVSQAEMRTMQAEAASENALYIVTSLDGGKTFGSPVKVADTTRPPSPLPNGGFRVFILPTLAVDPNNGTLYATWNDYAAGNSDTVLVRSTDGANSWSQPKRVNDDAIASRADQFFPTAVVGKDSTLHLLWLDRRDDSANHRYRPYYTRSTDGGSTFSKNAPVSANQSDPDVGFQGTLLGDYIAIDAAGDGDRFYSAWVDTRGGNQDIYFTTLDAASSSGAAPSTPAQPTAETPGPVPSPQPLNGFTDKAFIANWERADRAVLTGNAQRPWLWGPVSFAAATEPYKQGRQGTREVQYFDKARMEINNPQLDPTSPGYVTNGLLVVELISGRIQLGNAEFEAPRPPSDVPVAGDATSSDALTYASLAHVASLNGDNRAQDRTGQGVTSVLNRAGEVQDDHTKGAAVKLASFEPTLGHNIPDVFWAFMNASGPIYNGRFDTYSNGKVFNWESDLGFPITEPYWTNVKIGGVQKSVLVQAFQRRVLTYVQDNPPGWRVEMGNVGRHYFDWRYGRRP